MDEGLQKGVRVDEGGTSGKGPTSVATATLRVGTWPSRPSWSSRFSADPSVLSGPR